jgi:hypothetical protein
VKGQVERTLLREITLGKARSEEREAYKKYMAFKRHHSREARDTFLEKLADAIAKEEGVQHESVVKQLKTREQIRRTHRRIRWVFESQQQGAITFVEVSDSEGNMVERTSRDEVERACIEENGQRF